MGKVNKLFPRSVACAMPAFKNNHRGRTWDRCTIIDTEGNEHEAWLDTTWGFYVYFHVGEAKWRKVNFNNHFNTIDLIFDFRQVGTFNCQMTFIPDNPTHPEKGFFEGWSEIIKQIEL